MLDTCMYNEYILDIYIYIYIYMHIFPCVVPARAVPNDLGCHLAICLPREEDWAVDTMPLTGDGSPGVRRSLGSLVLGGYLCVVKGTSFVSWRYPFWKKCVKSTLYLGVGLFETGCVELAKGVSVPFGLERVVIES